MKNILEALNEVFGRLGYNTFYFIIGGLGLLIAQLIWKAINWLILRRNQRFLSRNLSPFFSDGDVDKATRYYIQTKFQNVSPAEDDEPNKDYIASAKGKIIPLFLKEVFKSSDDTHKYYLILADTGMGKTTFMINLFLRYTNQIVLWGIKYKIALFPLASPEVFSAIEDVPEKKNTILLLDAFDEDIEANKDHTVRLREILTRAKDFRAIVITCRTQFFPSEEELPTKAGYIKTYGDDQTEYKFQKLYLSVFDNRDIKKYLRKRLKILHYDSNFPFFHFGGPKRAWEIIEKSPNLVMRPLLLSYINDLLSEPISFRYSFEIYDVLIRKWINRESRKPGISEKYGSDESYGGLLYKFSQALAVDLYQQKRRLRGGYFIAKNEKLFARLRITDVTDLEDSEKDLKGKSLLNRSADGFKFAHKSIFEYFLARKCLEDGDFLANFDFEEMIETTRFFDEMLYCELEKAVSGVLNVRNGEDDVLLLQLTPPQLSTIKSLKLSNIGEFNIRILVRLTDVSEIVIVDKKCLRRLYELYQFFWSAKPAVRNLIDQVEAMEEVGWEDKLKDLEKKEEEGKLQLLGLKKIDDSPELRDLRAFRERKRRLEVFKRERWLKMLDQSQWMERLDRLGLRELRDRLESRDLKESLEKQELKERLEWERTRKEIYQQKNFGQQIPVFSNEHLRDANSPEKERRIDQLRQIECQKQLDRLELESFSHLSKTSDSIELQDLLLLLEDRRLKELFETLESTLKSNDDDIFRELKPINDFLRDVRFLKGRLPVCEFYY